MVEKVLKRVKNNTPATGPLLLQKTPKETALTSRRQLSAQTFPPVLSLHAENPQYSLVGVTGVGSEVRKTFQSIVTLINPKSTRTLDCARSSLSSQDQVDLLQYCNS